MAHNTGFLKLFEATKDNTSTGSDVVVKGGKYFLYHSDEDNEANKENIQQFKLKTGLLKSEKQFGQVVTEIGADGKAKNITNKKYLELQKLNTETAKYFLKFLHNMLWEDLKLTDKLIGADSIISSIDAKDAVEILKPLIEEIGFINSYILDMKYNPKVTAADVSMKIQKLRGDVAFGLNPIKAAKK